MKALALAVGRKARDFFQPRNDVDSKALWEKIQRLDFSFIKLKLTHEKHGLGWSKEDAEQGEIWYKRYIFLAAKYPEAYLVPNHLIDEFWHQHILDTRMYMRDCQEIFGEYHHHYPYAGLLGQEDYNRWMSNVDATKRLFQIEFNVDYDRCAGNKCTCFGGCKCRANAFEFERGDYFDDRAREPEAYTEYRNRIGAI